MSNSLSPQQATGILNLLKDRFNRNMHRHEKFSWQEISEKLNKNPHKLWSIYQMEQTGGEPDAVVFDQKSGEIFFVDCSPESPKGRRSLCYDRQALESRKTHKPQNSALDLAHEMDVEILTEGQYQALQTIDTFDTKTSSWILTPNSIRKLGGALFADRRYDTVFTYHNGAESYYASRGFRGFLRI